MADKDINIGIGGDDEDFNRKIDELIEKLKKLQSEKPVIKFEGEIQELIAKINEVTEKRDKLKDDPAAKVKFDGEIEELIAKIDKVEEKKTKASSDVDFSINAEAEEADAELDKFDAKKAEAAKPVNTVINVKTNVDRTYHDQMHMLNKDHEERAAQRQQELDDLDALATKRAAIHKARLEDLESERRAAEKEQSDAADWKRTRGLDQKATDFIAGRDIDDNDPRVSVAEDGSGRVISPRQPPRVLSVDERQAADEREADLRAKNLEADRIEREVAAGEPGRRAAHKARAERQEEIFDRAKTVADENANVPFVPLDESDPILGDFNKYINKRQAEAKKKKEATLAGELEGDNFEEVVAADALLDGKNPHDASKVIEAKSRIHEGLRENIDQNAVADDIEKKLASSAWKSSDIKGKPAAEKQMVDAIMELRTAASDGELINAPRAVRAAQGVTDPELYEQLRTLVSTTTPHLLNENNLDDYDVSPSTIDEFYTGHRQTPSKEYAQSRRPVKQIDGTWSSSKPPVTHFDEYDSEFGTAYDRPQPRFGRHRLDSIVDPTTQPQFRSYIDMDGNEQTSVNPLRPVGPAIEDTEVWTPGQGVRPSQAGGSHIYRSAEIGSRDRSRMTQAQVEGVWRGGGVPSQEFHDRLTLSSAMAWDKKQSENRSRLRDLDSRGRGLKSVADDEAANLLLTEDETSPTKAAYQRSKALDDIHFDPNPNEDIDDLGEAEGLNYIPEKQTARMSKIENRIDALNGAIQRGGGAEFMYQKGVLQFLAASQAREDGSIGTMSRHVGGMYSTRRHLGNMPDATQDQLDELTANIKSMLPDLSNMGADIDRSGTFPGITVHSVLAAERWNNLREDVAPKQMVRMDQRSGELVKTTLQHWWEQGIDPNSITNAADKTKPIRELTDQEKSNVEIWGDIFGKTSPDQKPRKYDPTQSDGHSERLRPKPHPDSSAISAYSIAQSKEPGVIQPSMPDGWHPPMSGGFPRRSGPMSVEEAWGQARARSIKSIGGFIDTDYARDYGMLVGDRLHGPGKPIPSTNIKSDPLALQFEDMNPDFSHADRMKAIEDNNEKVEPYDPSKARRPDGSLGPEFGADYFEDDLKSIMDTADPSIRAELFNESVDIQRQRNAKKEAAESASQRKKEEELLKSRAEKKKAAAEETRRTTTAGEAGRAASAASIDSDAESIVDDVKPDTSGGGLLSKLRNKVMAGVIAAQIGKLEPEPDVPALNDELMTSIKGISRDDQRARAGADAVNKERRRLKHAEDMSLADPEIDEYAPLTDAETSHPLWGSRNKWNPHDGGFTEKDWLRNERAGREGYDMGYKSPPTESSGSGGGGGGGRIDALKNAFDGSGNMPIKLASIGDSAVSTAAKFSLIGSAASTGFALAAGAMSSMPALMAGISAGAGSIFLGFHNVIGAIQAYTQAQTQSAQTSAAVAAQASSNAQQIEQAQNAVAQSARALAEAQRQSAYSTTMAEQQSVNAQIQAKDSLRQANEQVVQSQQQLKDAEFQSTVAQRNLTQAYIDARNSLQNYQDQLKDGALNQKQQILNVQEAQASLQQTLGDPTATALQRQQAQLSYQEAVQQQKDQADQYGQLQVAAANAAKYGVKGNLEVMQAQQGVIDASNALKNAQVAVADAAINKSEQEYYAVVNVEDANLNLTQTILNGQDQVASAQNSYNQSVLALGFAYTQVKLSVEATQNANTTFLQAMGKLSPTGQQFVNWYTANMKPIIHQLSTSSETGLLPGIQKGLIALTPLIQAAGPVLQTAAKGAGDFFAALGQFMGSKQGVAEFQATMKNGFKFLDGMGNFILDIVKAFGKLGPIAGPAITAISNGLQNIGQHFLNWSSGTGPIGAISLFAKILPQLGGILNSTTLPALLLGSRFGMLGFFVGLFHKQLKPLIEPMLHFATIALKIIQHDFGPVVGQMAKAAGNLLTAVIPLLPSIAFLAAQFAGSMAGDIQAIADVMKVAAPIISSMSGALVPLANILPPVILLFAGLKKVAGFAKTISDLKLAFTETIPKLLGFGGAGAAAGAGGEAAGVGGEAAGAGMTAALGPIGLVLLGIAAFAFAAYEIVKHWKTISHFFKEVWHEVMHIFDIAFDFIKKHAKLFIEALIIVITGPMGLLAVLIYNNWNRIMDFFEKLPGRIGGFFSRFGTDLYNWIVQPIINLVKNVWNAAINIVTGLWNGISSMGSWLYNKISGWVNKQITGAIHDVLSIFSPSRVMHQTGIYIVQGLANGITESGPIVAEAIKAMAQKHIIPTTAAIKLDSMLAQDASLSAIRPGSSSASTATKPQPTTIVLQINGKQFAKAVYPDLISTLLQNKRSIVKLGLS